MENESLLECTRRLMRLYGIRARKGLGQNFLINEEVLNSILDAAGLSEDDTVVEVGPGLGVMTERLARRAGRIIAVELDDRLAALLQKNLSSCGNVTIVHNDILQVEPRALLEMPGKKPLLKDYKVVANLPYYITSPVLRHFLEATEKPSQMVVMVQKEVAAEICAAPGKMSLLGIGMQFYGKPEIVSIVPSGCFFPSPEVDSAVVKVIPYTEPPVDVDDEADFFNLVRAGFRAARKQLPNSLVQGLEMEKADVLTMLDRASIEPQRRAETLSLEDWARLWKVYRKADGEAC